MSDFIPDFKVIHIGINAADESSAQRAAEEFSARFGFPVKGGNSSIFADKSIEIMKKPFLGAMGHIAVGTHDVDAAVAYFEARGYAFRKDTLKRGEDGVAKAVYFADDIAGFAVHLLKTENKTEPSRDDIVEKIKRDKLIAIIRGVYGQDCVNLARALQAGGINLLEVTFDRAHPETFKDTASAILAAKAALGEKIAVGAGTVMSVETVEMAYEAGARYIISPNMDVDVIRRTVALGMVSMPGAVTPTEIEAAHNAGADFVKIFPAGTLGPKYIKAICAPLNHVKILAVGGVNEKNIPDFLAAGVVGCGVGGGLVDKSKIAAGAFDEITSLAKVFVEASNKKVQ